MVIYWIPKNKNKNKNNKPRRPRGRRPRRRTGGTTSAGSGGGSSSSVGGRIGASLGRTLGSFAEKGLGKIFGFGEYKEQLANEIGHPAEDIAENATPEVNSLVKPVQSRDTVPLMHMDKEGHVRFARREFIQTIQIRDTTIRYAFKLNPGRAADFPWLSGVATSFQQYAFLGLAFEYVPTSGFAISGNSAALGQVAMTFNYNVSNPGGWPDTLTGILNMQGSTSCSPAAPGTCYMECDPHVSNQPIRFVETETSTYTGMSTQNYIAADFIVETSGAQTVAPAYFQAGQLWVTYEILLFNPRPIDPTPSLSEMPCMKDYRNLVERYQALSSSSGPFTCEQYIIWDGEIRRIWAEFGTPKFLAVLEQARIERARLLPLEEPKEEGMSACDEIIESIALLTPKVVFTNDGYVQVSSTSGPSASLGGSAVSQTALLTGRH